MSPNRMLTGIIGANPSQYSKSPVMWNAAFQFFDLDATYQAFDVSEHDLPSLIQTFRKDESLRGFNVTIPYKIKIMGYLDAVAPLAQQAGAVNTVVRDTKGHLRGFNTDITGVLETLCGTWQGQPPLFKSLGGLRVLLLGAGGASRAVIAALGNELGEKGEILIVNRDVEKAKSVALAFHESKTRIRWGTLSELENQIQGFDLIVNATSVGQFGLESPLGERSIRLVNASQANAVFFDLIYSPSETLLLSQAKSAGRKIVNGQPMIVAQAVEAFRLMFGDFPKNDLTKIMAEAFEKNI
ncbi:MAG: Shikimate dehydrogenase (NADP(+)) [Elusimicrobia bacterium]|nr:Shikimate dehydrogenase (NADP(+)) [Elusimicrobiota bacterium]